MSDDRHQLTPTGTGGFKQYTIRDGGQLKVVMRLAHNKWYTLIKSDFKLINAVAILTLEEKYKAMVKEDRTDHDCNVIQFPKQAGRTV